MHLSLLIEASALIDDLNAKLLLESVIGGQDGDGFTPAVFHRDLDQVDYYLLKARIVAN